MMMFKKNSMPVDTSVWSNRDKRFQRYRSFVTWAPTKWLINFVQFLEETTKNVYRRYPYLSHDIAVI